MSLITPIRGLSVIPGLVLDTFYLRTKFGDYRFSRSGDMHAGIETETGSCDPGHAHFWGDLLSVS